MGALVGPVFAYPINLALVALLGVTALVPGTPTEQALILTLDGLGASMLFVGLGMGLGQWLLLRQYLQLAGQVDPCDRSRHAARGIVPVELTARYSAGVDRTAHGSRWRDLARRVPMVRVARASAACRVVGRPLPCGLGANAGVCDRRRIPSALLRISLGYRHYCYRNSFTLCGGGGRNGLAIATDSIDPSSYPA